MHFYACHCLLVNDHSYKTTSKVIKFGFIKFLIGNILKGDINLYLHGATRQKY